MYRYFFLVFDWVIFMKSDVINFFCFIVTEAFMKRDKILPKIDCIILPISFNEFFWQRNEKKNVLG